MENNHSHHHPHNLQGSSSYSINYPLALCLVFSVLFLAACGQGGPKTIPLEKIKADLADESTYSILLDDMKEEGTFLKNYHHKYLVVKTDTSTRTDWLKVPENYYNANREFLGMALVSKKDGEMDNQVAPPGYSYVGDPQYGTWKQDSQGGSFWEFYGKYALFSTLFGGWNRPIYRSDYAGYNQHRSTNRPYFGRNREFGSAGTIVKNKRPDFYSRRMSAVGGAGNKFKQKASQRTGRTKTGFRGRSGGLGK